MFNVLSILTRSEAGRSGRDRIQVTGSDRPTATPLDDTGGFLMGSRPAGFRRILESIMHVGRDLLARTHQSTGPEDQPADTLIRLCRQILDHRGEVSGLALADEILSGYQALPPDERLAFFGLLSEQFEPDRQAIVDAAEAYRSNPEFDTRSVLAKAVEAPRLRLFRRLNMVPNGTSRLVAMRGHLLDVIQERPELRALESDLRHLLIAWFNRGFLVMEQIDWTGSANVLERIIAHEAVHEINGWDDLRARLAADRRCFALFHPAMPDDPLIFVEVALTDSVADAIAPLIAKEREIANVRETDTAIFYSISNCHDGLRGISFGHFLIKQVLEELRRDLDHIKQFATLSPVPGFCQWVTDTSPEVLAVDLQDGVAAARDILNGTEPLDPAELSDDSRALLMRLCAHYLLNETHKGEPMDAVARFHLGNGAALEQINWAADFSLAGIERSAGIMVNYVYRLEDIEKNHERYFAEGEVVASAAVRKLAILR